MVLSLAFSGKQLSRFGISVVKSKVTFRADPLLIPGGSQARERFSHFPDFGTGFLLKYALFS